MMQKNFKNELNEEIQKCFTGCKHEAKLLCYDSKYTKSHSLRFKI